MSTNTWYRHWWSVGGQRQIVFTYVYKNLKNHRQMFDAMTNIALSYLWDSLSIIGVLLPSLTWLNMSRFCMKLTYNSITCHVARDLVFSKILVRPLSSYTGINWKQYDPGDPMSKWAWIFMLLWGLTLSVPSHRHVSLLLSSRRKC